MVDDVVGIFVLYRIVDYIVEVLAMMGEAVVDYTKLQRVTITAIHRRKARHAY